ncbi:hypothetical protein D3C76_444520 [compost metagenome]
MQQAARGQGAEQYGVAEVGGGGGHHGHARPDRQLQAFEHSLDIAGQCPVADHHALGLAGRTRGVDQISRLLWADRDRHRAVAAGRPRRGLAGNRLQAVEASEAGIARLMQQHGGAAVDDQLLQALLRLLGIQRQVGGAGLEHRQHGRDPIDGAWQAQGNDAAGTDATLAQVVGYAVGRSVQPALGHEALTSAHAALGLPLRHRLVPQGEEVAVRVGFCCGRLLRRYLQVVDDRLLLGMAQHVQHAPQRIGEALDGGGFEQVGGVGEVPLDAIGFIREVERQVEARIATFTGEAFHLQRAQALARRVARRHVLVDLELEQRVVGQVALGQQGIDQVLERQFLVRLSAADHVFYLLQQRGEGGALVHLHAQHLGVDEEADQAFQLLAVTPRIRRADADVRLPAVARQHHRHGRQHQHEQRVPALARLAAQRFGLLGANLQFEHCAAVARRGGPFEVQRQAQQRLLVTQLRLPIRQLALGLTGLEPGALPDRIVGVLDRQGRQLRLAAFSQGGVQLDELLHQQVARPTVGDDVVHAQGQYVVLGAQAQQGDPHQRPGQQVERLLERGIDGFAQGGFIVARLELDHVQHQRAGVENLLVELAFIRYEARTQRLMTADQRIQRLLQHR